MIGKLSKMLVQKLLSYEKIGEEDSELYEYGFFMMLSRAYFIALCGIAGLLFGIFWESLIFCVVFQLIREYAGGYHADTELRCQALSFVCILAAVGAMRLFYNAGVIAMAAVLGVTAVITVLSAPQDTPGKPLSEAQRKRFKKICLIITAVCLITAAIAMIARVAAVYLPVTVSIALESVLLIVGAGKKALVHNK